MSNFSIDAIGGHRKSIEEGIGTGGGYVAQYEPKLDFNFGADPTDAQKKLLDERVASTNIWGQANAAS